MLNRFVKGHSPDIQDYRVTLEVSSVQSSLEVTTPLLITGNTSIHSFLKQGGGLLSEIRQDIPLYIFSTIIALLLGITSCYH